MHTPVQTILTATDLSVAASAAVRRAALIARAHDAKLELVHVLSNSIASCAWRELRAAFATMEVDIRVSATASLDALVAEVQSEIGVPASPVVVDGKPFAEIAGRSEVVQADVVVVGAHGENLLTPLLGTTAHRVLRFARRPVLLVKQQPSLAQGATHSGYEHIVIATDFSEDSQQAAMSARRLFPQSRLTLFHAYLAPFEAKISQHVSKETLEQYRGMALQEARRELDAFANALELRDARRIARHGVPGVSIRNYATEVSADLIAIGSEEVPRLQSALLGSVSLDVVTQATCDVLLARTGCI